MEPTTETAPTAPRTLTPASFLNRPVPPVRAVPVELPELGGTGHVRKLTAAELDDYFVFLRTHGEKEPSAGRLLVWVLCDADGKRLFADHQAGELERSVEAIVTQRVMTAFREANGLDREALRKK